MLFGVHYAFMDSFFLPEKLTFFWHLKKGMGKGRSRGRLFPIFQVSALAVRLLVSGSVHIVEAHRFKHQENPGPAPKP